MYKFARIKKQHTDKDERKKMNKVTFFGIEHGAVENKIGKKRQIKQYNQEYPGGNLCTLFPAQVKSETGDEEHDKIFDDEHK